MKLIMSSDVGFRPKGTIATRDASLSIKTLRLKSYINCSKFDHRTELEFWGKNTISYFSQFPPVCPSKSGAVLMDGKPGADVVSTGQTGPLVVPKPPGKSGNGVVPKSGQIGSPVTGNSGIGSVNGGIVGIVAGVVV